MRRRARSPAQLFGGNVQRQQSWGNAMSIVGVLTEIAVWAEPAVAGWRYLFSATYRHRKREEWRHERVAYVVFDVVGGIIGAGISIAVVAIIVAIALDIG